MTPEPLKILLVENNTADARLVQELQKVGKTRLELTRITQIETSSALLADNIFYLLTASHVVLLVSIPHTQAFELVQRWRSIKPDVAIVVLAAQDDEDAALQLLRLGVQDYLVKNQTTATMLVRALQFAHARTLAWRQLAPLTLENGALPVATNFSREADLNSTQQMLNVMLAAANSEVRLAQLTEDISAKLNICRQIIAKSNDAIALIDLQGYYLEQNATHQLLLGYADAELKGKTPAIHLGAAVFAQIYEQLLKSDSYYLETVSRTKSGALLQVEILAFTVRDEAGKPICYVGIKRDLTTQKQAKLALISRDCLLESVAAATNYLLTTKDFADAMSSALAVLGKATNVNRVYIFENQRDAHTGEMCMSQRFEWTDTSVRSEINNPELQNLPYNTLSDRWYNTLAAGKPISGFIKDFPENERRILSAQQIVSILLVPIVIKGEFWGFIGFDDCQSQREWTETEQAILIAVAGSIGGAIIRKRIEEALQKSEQRFRAIFERSGIGIALANLQGKFLECNPASTKILGYTQAELCRMHVADYTYPDDMNTDSEMFAQLVAGKLRNYEVEKRYIHKDGYLVWGRLNVSLVQNSLGAQFVICMIEDITQRKQAEIELHKNKEAAEVGSRAKSEFLATISHELRTPLQAVLGLSDLLQQEIFGSLNTKQKNYISCIYNSGEHLLSLINDILDLSKVEAGKEELNLAPLGVQELCEYCLTIVRDRAESKGLQLTLEFDLQAKCCYADERRVKQMLLNLLTNAIKFTPTGRVSLRTQKLTQGIGLIVADTGIGIAAQQLELIFQPFKQLDSEFNRQYEGTGLGLALTRKLARLHGGDVTVQSTLGKGSEFTLVLPDCPQKLENTAQTLAHNVSSSYAQQNFVTEELEDISIGNAPHTTPRILIVEADYRSATILQSYLHTIGYQVKHLAKTEDFLAQVRRFQPSLILLDTQLANNVTSLELVQHLRQQPSLQNLPVALIVETEFSTEMRDRALELNINAFLFKPIGITALESVLWRYFDK